TCVRTSRRLATAPISSSRRDLTTMPRHAELVRDATTTRFVQIHGHDVAYRTAGEGPVILLIHGIAGSSATWSRVMADLAEVYPFLRAVSLPGSEVVLPLVLHRSIHDGLETVGRWFGRLGLRGGHTGAEVWRSYTALTETRGQLAFIHTIRSVIDVRGQRVS